MQRKKFRWSFYNYKYRKQTIGITLMNRNLTLKSFVSIIAFMLDRVKFDPARSQASNECDSPLPEKVLTSNLLEKVTKIIFSLKLSKSPSLKQFSNTLVKKGIYCKRVVILQYADRFEALPVFDNEAKLVK